MIPRALLAFSPILLLTCALTPLGAQDPAPSLAFRESRPLDYQSARELTDQAQKLQSQGDWLGALGLLEDPLRQCQENPKRSACLLLNYTAGYLYQKQAEQDAGKAENLYRQAADFYRNVLRSRPDHGPTLANLALVSARIESSENQIEQLRAAIRNNPQDAATYAARLGDLHGEKGDWEKALDAYSKGAKQDPDDEQIRLRIVHAYSNLPAVGLLKLMKLCRKWETSFPSAARTAYSAVMMRFREQEALADTALVRWLSLSARQRLLQPGRVKEFLPRGWTSQAVTDLKAYLESPLEEPSGSSWWRRESERRQALAEAALAIGEGWLLDKRPDWTSTCWNVGWRISPSYKEYDSTLSGAPVVRLELQTRLASLLARYPRFDSDDAILREMLRDLFSGKSRAYRLRDLEAIQRHHSTLGVLFFEKGILDVNDARRMLGLDHRAYNAIFQLKNAVTTAKRRDKNTGGYQPLARIKRYLAQALQQRPDEGDAATAFLDAAEAYLDQDDLKQAARMLDNARETGRPDRRRVRNLTQVMSLRARILNGSPQELAQIRVDPQAQGWLFASDRRNRSFLARQRFKIFSDLTSRLPNDGDGARQALENAVQALKTAAEKDASLVGAGDVVRLRKVQNLLNDRTGSSQRKIRFQSKSSKNEDSVLLTLPGQTKPSYIRIDKGALDAKRITQRIGAKNVVDAQRLATQADGNVSKTALNAYLKGRSAQQEGGAESLAKSVEYYDKALRSLPDYSPAQKGRTEATRSLSREQPRGRSDDSARPDARSPRTDPARNDPDRLSRNPGTTIDTPATSLTARVLRLYYAGRLKKAGALVATTLRSNPKSLSFQRLGERIAWSRGDVRSAYAHFGRVLTLLGANRSTLKALESSFEQAGAKGLLSWKSRWLGAQLRRGAATRYDLAEVAVLMGDHKGAIDWIEPALRREKAGSPQVERLLKDPIFGKLRSDRRFVALLRRYGLR